MKGCMMDFLDNGAEVMVYMPWFLSMKFLLLVLFVAVLGVLIYASVYRVRQAEVLIIERFGKFDRLLEPGIHILIPFVDQVRKVHWTFLRPSGNPGSNNYYRYIKDLKAIDLRESTYDFPKQNVITRDNVVIEINALLYYQITDPKAAVYEIDDLPEAIEKLTQTKLRDVVGAMDLDETLVSRDTINQRLRLTLDEATDKWGVKVNRVELQEVNPPVDIRHAMEKQMRAERTRRAQILEAEGSKQSSILLSEGKKQAAILDAEGQMEASILQARGDAESRLIKADAEAQVRLKTIEAESTALKMIAAAMPHGDPIAYMIAMQYIKTLPEVTGGKDSKLVLMPYEATALAGSLGAMKELLKSS